LLIIAGFSQFSCNELDLAPLSTASTGNWYNNEEQFNMAINNLYHLDYWNEFDNGGSNWFDAWTDDMSRRTDLADVTSGSLSSATGWVRNFWGLRYESIQNTNSIIAQLGTAEGISEDRKFRIEADARF